MRIEAGVGAIGADAVPNPKLPLYRHSAIVHSAPTEDVICSPHLPSYPMDLPLVTLIWVDTIDIDREVLK